MSLKRRLSKLEATRPHVPHVPSEAALELQRRILTLPPEAKWPILDALKRRRP